MPKVISGNLKGRKINGFDIEGTRPTMDRVKESLFAMISYYLPDSIILDLFSGSGNLGIEAISNGAKKGYFNDYNKKCVQIIKDNINNLGINEKCVITSFDYLKALEYYHKENIKFDIIFLDPPYKDLINENIMDNILKKDLLKDKGIIVCEVNYCMNYNNSNYTLIKEKKYGDKYIYIYQWDKSNM